MRERDELRGTLANTICNASNYTKRAQPHLLGSDMSGVLDKTADAILAAGYRKPRTVTTAEELDALPAKSVILDQAGTPWIGDGDNVEPWASVCEDPFGGPIWADSRVIPLPATVLHEGTQP